MDLKEYISSGILESYVLGTDSDQEQREVQCLSAMYPEIGEARQALEADMETFAQSMAQTPPVHLKASILAAIKDIAQESPLQKVSSTTNEAKTVAPAPMTVSKTNRPWMAVASLLALIALTVIFFINQNKQQKSMLALQEKMEQTESSNTQLNAMNEWLANERTRKIQLNGTENQPDAKVAVFWNDETQDVAFKVSNLPNLADDKDYQLWAIVDGKPTDMGVMDYKNALAQIVKSGSKVANAQAFAITIEPKGGSKDPTLSSMVVVGNT